MRLARRSFHRGHGEEGHAAADAEAGEFEGEGGAEGVHEETFKGVVVERAESVGDVKAVVPRVEVA